MLMKLTVLMKPMKLSLPRVLLFLPILVLMLSCSVMAQERLTDERRGSRMKRNREIWVDWEGIPLTAKRTDFL